MDDDVSVSNVSLGGPRPAKSVRLEFNELKFSVQIKGPEKKVSDRKYILKGISGTCEPGRLCAMMGSSGAGKTTLLDILACNFVSGGKIEGELLVNGKPRNSSEFRQDSCYVLQSDVLLSSATVRESLLTSALLKLPRSISRRQKVEKVDQILKELGLTSCQNTLIGDEFLGIKGISGGQKRRVSIGVELVKNPAAIFLDEPTSGLDSEIAVSLVELLGDMCKRGRTVVLTIHQPNSLITSKFEDFILLADGKLVYGGPWSNAVDFFKRAGFACPQYMNPPDYFIHALMDQKAIAILVDQQKKSKTLSTDLEKPSQDEEFHPGVETEIVHKSEPQESAWYQIYVLALRNFRTYIRNPIYLVSETAQYAFMGIFVGLMYLQLNNSVETGVQDRLASIWFGMAVLSFTPSFSAVVAWDKDRLLLRRESGQSMYSILSWYSARTLVNIPLQFLQTLLYCAIAYFMVGYKITLTNILIFYAAYALFQVISESVGLMCAAVTTTASYATLALTFVLLVLLSFSGFLVSDVPVYFKWVTKISYLTYAYSAISVSQFSTTDFVCETGTDCVQGQTYPGSDLLPSSVDNGISPGVNLLILLGITVGCRVLTFLLILGAKFIGFL